MSEAANYTDIREIPSKGVYAYYTCHKGQDIFVLKGLKPQYQNKPQYAHVLQREYNKCSGLHHDGVVAYFDLIDIEEKGKCIVFEYIDARPLNKYIAERHTDSEILSILRELAVAIDYCHENKIVHGNLKPSNILITKNGDHVKLIDFRVLDTDESAEPSLSLKYLAPELRDGTMQVDGSADIYSLGVLFKDFNFSSSADGVIARCCSFGRYERYATAAEAVDALSSRGERTHGSYIKWYVSIAVIALVVIIALDFFGSHTRNSVSSADSTAVADSQTEQQQQGAAATTQQGADSSLQVSGVEKNTSDQPQVDGKDVVEQIKPALYADIDRIFQPYIDGTKKGHPSARIKAYYKGLIKSRHFTLSEREQLDQIFAQYVREKSAQIVQ